MLDPDFAAVFLKVVDKRIHQDRVLCLPAHQVEVTGRFHIVLVMRLEPAGPQTGLVAGQVLRGPGDVQAWRASRSGHVLHLRVGGVSVSQGVEMPANTH